MDSCSFECIASKEYSLSGGDVIPSDTYALRFKMELATEKWFVDKDSFFVMIERKDSSGRIHAFAAEVLVKCNGDGKCYSDDNEDKCEGENSNHWAMDSTYPYTFQND